MKISDEDRERYDIPHVDEIQQALMEDEEFLRAEAEAVQENMLEQAKVDEELWFESEAEFDRRDEVYPDEE